MSNMNSILEGIHDLLEEEKKEKRDLFHLCDRIVQELTEMPENERGAYFSTLFQNYKISDTGLNLADAEKRNKNKALEIMRGIVRVELDDLLAKNDRSETFYQALWPTFFPQDSFTNGIYEPYIKAATLILLWNNKCIPYFQRAEGIIMENDEYKTRREKNGLTIKNLQYLLWSTNYTQKTEKASVLWRFINSIEDERDRAVCFAAIIDEFRQ